MGVIVNGPFQGGRLPEALTRAPLPVLANEIGAQSWPQLILAFIISHPAVTVAIPTTTLVVHLRENKAAGRLPMLDTAQRGAIAEAIKAA